VESGTILIAHLFVEPGRNAEFRRFEQAAARIMARHGGRIERVIRPIAAPAGQALPDEIHVVWFPSPERLEAYRQDPELAGLASLRKAAIARTEVILGEPGAPYPVAG
jgi:uncharacterized protein (DUF1330 family)